MNSRDKGARGEVELAKFLRSYGYETRRGQQFCGANGDADVVGLPGIHVECKRVEKMAVNDWLNQSIRDAHAESQKENTYMMPVVFHRQNYDVKKPCKGMWKVTMLASDFMDLYGRARR